MFISSLHNIKSKNFKKNWKSMKGICFTFDAFGQWSEHDKSKMEWRMKVGIEWRPSMAGRPKIASQPATVSLLSTFPLHYLPLYLNHHTFGTKFRGTGYMGWPPGHHPWPAGHPMAPL
jgi:hypothetical protein